MCPNRLPPSFPLLVTVLNWLHFNTKSRHFFFSKLSFLESPWGRSRGGGGSCGHCFKAFFDKCGFLRPSCVLVGTQLSRVFAVSGVWSIGCEPEPGLAEYSLQGTLPDLPRADFGA